MKTKLALLALCICFCTSCSSPVEAERSTAPVPVTPAWSCFDYMTSMTPFRIFQCNNVDSATVSIMRGGHSEYDGKFRLDSSTNDSVATLVSQVYYEHLLNYLNAYVPDGPEEYAPH
jgi:hypothetical protein